MELSFSESYKFVIKILLLVNIQLINQGKLIGTRPPSYGSSQNIPTTEACKSLCERLINSTYWELFHLALLVFFNPFYNP